MNRIASLHLLESGNIEVHVPSDRGLEATMNVVRFCAVAWLWDNPEFQALLDRAIQADKGGVAFE